MVKKVSKKKVLMALSGGIDSAVSAYLLLKQGYEVEAAFMKNWTSTTGLKYNECPWLADRQDALRVAAFLDIPLHTLDFEKEYQKNVMGYFFKEYKAGRTPNPDVMCNKEVKFKLLYNWAMKNGFDYMATGHYAQVVDSGQWAVNSKKKNYPLPIKHYALARSADEFKDQTYFIYNIKTEQLPHVIFPIGGMKKPEVRKLAQKIGLPNAGKKESMGLCFVGKIRLKDFLEQKLKPKKGDIVLTSRTETGPVIGHPHKASTREDIKGARSVYGGPPTGATRFPGTIIGQHFGLHNYTIGQRQGVKVGGSGGPYYVVRKDLKKNILYVTNDANDPALEVRELEIHSVNWIDKSMESSAASLKLTGRYRHQGDLVALEICNAGKSHYLVKFKKPQKAVASGQSLVLYKGKICVGGGVIV